MKSTKLKNVVKTFCITVPLILNCVESANSQNTKSDGIKPSVFLCKDNDGKTFYCTDPWKYKDSTQTNLPRIGRENIDEKINEIKSSKLETCIKHGGDKCELGPDADGSIVCSDGYRNSSIQFEQICKFARIQHLSFFVFNDAQSILSQNDLASVSKSSLNSYLLRLSVRNNSQSPAQNVSVFFDTRRTRDIKADGPEVIPAFGTGEFTLAPAKLTGGIPIWDEIRYKLTCSNCDEISGILQFK